jgi:hypothetical protein
MPERPYTQANNYKERQYPALQVMKELHAAGKLIQAQELFMAPRKPEEEFYDLKNDPDEIQNRAGLPEYDAELKRFRKVLEKWMAECDDRADRHGEVRN